VEVSTAGRQADRATAPEQLVQDVGCVDTHDQRTQAL
jgi:hypothetical protein